jgi:hypothetical protein
VRQTPDGEGRVKILYDEDNDDNEVRCEPSYSFRLFRAIVRKALKDAVV